MRFALLACAYVIMLMGCSRETAETPVRETAARTVPLPDDSTLVAQGGVTLALPEGLHRDLVRTNCTVCHSPALIMQQRLSRDQWDRTITWMQENQNLWELDPDTRRSILDYLAANFGADVDARENPEPVYLPNPVW